MSKRHSVPCRAWAPLLAAAPGELTATQREALEAHLAGCAGCSATRVAYQRMDEQVRALPAPAPLPDLPPRLLRLWAAEDARPAQWGATGEGTHAASVGQNSSQPLSLNHHDQGQRHIHEGMRTMQNVPTSPVHPPRRPRRAASWIGASVAVVLVLLFGLVFIALPHGNTRPGAGGHHTATNLVLPTPTALTTPTVLAAGAMGAAYLGQDSRLHIVTLDGAHDTTGRVLEGMDSLTQPDNGHHALAAAPDGSAFAYIETPTGTTSAAPPSGAVVIINVANGASNGAGVPAADLWWSPDSSQLAADGYDSSGMGPVWIIDAKTGKVRQISATLNGQHTEVFRIAGWLDATHLAVLANRSPATALVPARGMGSLLALPASGGPGIALDVLDISSGALRHLADLTSPPDVFVAPDGKAIFVAPSTWVPTGYVVDPATGATRDLPNISNTFASQFVNIGNVDFATGGNWATAMAWLPGTHTVAMSLAAWGEGVEGSSGASTQQSGVWLLNLDHDSATSLTKDSYPLGFGDATASGAPLLVSSLPPSGVLFAGRSTGPVLSVLPSLAPGARAIVLTRSMLKFIGLVRVA